MENNKDFSHDAVLKKLVSLSSEEFLDLGNDGLSYIKQSGDVDGQPIYALHAADGSHVASGQDAEALRVIARQNSWLSMPIQ